MFDVCCKEPCTRPGIVWDAYERRCWDATDWFFVSHKRSHREMEQTIEALKRQLQEEQNACHQQMQQRLQDDQLAHEQQVSQLQQKLQHLQQQLLNAEHQANTLNDHSNIGLQGSTVDTAHAFLSGTSWLKPDA